MNCSICNKPTPPDSIHTCSPVPLLTAGDAQCVTVMYGLFQFPDSVERIEAAIAAIRSGRVACCDTQAGVCVPFMSEDEALERFQKWRRGSGNEMHRHAEFTCYLAALRDLGVIKP